MTERELKEIRAKISCPHLGDDHYGEWGILTQKQRLTIKRLLDYIESQEQYIRKMADNGVMVAVRCKDCIHKTVTVDGEYDAEDIVCGYHMSDGFCDNDFCSYGERKESV